MSTRYHRRTVAALVSVLTGAASLALVPASAPAAGAAAPDLVVTGPRVDRTTIAEGAVLTVTHRVKNAGRSKAGASRTRFYLTRDVAGSLAARKASRTNPRSAPTDLLLTGVRAVPGLARGAQSAVLTTKVTVPVGVQPGSYRVLVCADDQASVKEKSETNNCAAASQALRVGATPGAAGLRLEQFTDTTQWPADESQALQWMKVFCSSTEPVKAFTTASALASVESFLREQAGSDALADVAGSGLADDAAEAQALAATAHSQGSPGLALAALLRARRFEPRNGTHLLNLAALATAVGLPNEGLALLDGAAALDFRRSPLGIQPQAVAAAVRGQALALTGRLGPARTAFSAARLAEPLLSEADAGLAVVEACSGNDAKALRYARYARQRTTKPKPATEDPTKPEPVQPEPPLDLSQGVVTPLRQLPIAETPAQGVRMHDQYVGIDEDLFAEIEVDNAEADAIEGRLDAVDQVSTRAEQMRRHDITTFAYLVGTHGDEADELQDRFFAKLNLLDDLRVRFFGGATGSLDYTYARLSEEAHSACVGSEDYPACYDAHLTASCRPALTAAHTQWRGLVSEAQNLADEYMVELSSKMSAYAANLADPDAHRRIILQIEISERITYALLVQEGRIWTNLERIHEDHCVTPQETQPVATPADVEGASPGACEGPLSKISIVAALGPTKVKVNCEQVKQELAVDALPFVQAFAEVSYSFRTGKVTVFAGSKFKAGLGPAEAQFKSGVYLSTDGQGDISDVGWRVGPEVKAATGPYEVGVYKDYQDISFVAAFSPTP